LTILRSPWLRAWSVFSFSEEIQEENPNLLTIISDSDKIHRF